MKILLIQPPMTLLKNEIKSVVFPLGLAYIAASLEKNGYEVEVMDCVVLEQRNHIERDGMIHFGLDWPEISERIEKSNPDAIGISCLFSSQSSNAYKVAELAKQWNHKVPTIMGGAHPSSIPKEVLTNKNIDYIVLGEGDETIIHLVKNLHSFEHLKKIDGIGFKHDDSIIINPKTKFIENIDDLPFPARHLFPMELYFESEYGHGTDLMRKPLSSMITSRGCPYMCVFCSVHTVWGRNYRPRDPKKVVDEIELLVKKFGVREIHFEDDNLTLKKDRTIAICKEIIKRKIDLKWTTPNGVALWTLDKEVLVWMKRAGCYKLCFGIESGDMETQKFIRKHVPLDRCKEIVKEANKLGIWTHGFFIIGFPFENTRSIHNTIRYAIDSNLDFASFFLATPYPKTDLYTIMDERGMIKNLTWDTLRVSAASINTEYFTRGELRGLQREMFKEFVAMKFLRIFNPVKLGIQIRKLNSKDDIRFIIRYIRRFFQIVNDN
ncbi:MAG: cobalamin-dependent protein [Candidatus Aenigmarchaeota archaeon]|nr:cobalamin-dependent protein [Candidatus Aenigmarchaeota archaeon]